jgi:hypothetical protein
MITKHKAQKRKKIMHRLVWFFIVCSMFYTLFFLPSHTHASAEWEVTLRVEAGTGHNQLVLGADATATDGYDPVWEVYAMLGGEIAAYFPHFDWPMVHQVFWRDIKAKAPGTITEWLFEVDSSLNNYDFTIRWDISRVPENYTIFLIDDSTGQGIDMRLSSSFSFLYTDIRSLRVAVYVPPDIETPDPPQKLTAKTHKSGVTLSWKKNRESDLDGYNVYRSIIPGSDYQKINSSLIPKSRYIDGQVTKGETYYYVITAVNTAGGESGFSNEIRITIIE